MKSYKFIVGLGPHQGSTIVIIQANSPWDATKLAEMQYGGKKNVQFYGEVRK